MRKPILTASKQNLISTIMFAILAVICFINIKAMWKLCLICAFLSILNFALYIRHKKKEQELDMYMENFKDFLNEDETDNKKMMKPIVNKEKNIQKSEYDNYIKKINEELDFDIDEYEEDDDNE